MNVRGVGVGPRVSHMYRRRETSVQEVSVERVSHGLGVVEAEEGGQGGVRGVE
jgi:hypothetical protein